MKVRLGTVCSGNKGVAGVRACCGDSANPGPGFGMQNWGKSLRKLRLSAKDDRSSSYTKRTKCSAVESHFPRREQRVLGEAACSVTCCGLHGLTGVCPLSQDSPLHRALFWVAVAVLQLDEVSLYSAGTALLEQNLHTLDSLRVFNDKVSAASVPRCSQ